MSGELNCLHPSSPAQAPGPWGACPCFFICKRERNRPYLRLPLSGFDERPRAQHYNRTGHRERLGKRRLSPPSAALRKASPPGWLRNESRGGSSARQLFMKNLLRARHPTRAGPATGCAKSFPLLPPCCPRRRSRKEQHLLHRAGKGAGDKLPKAIQRLSRSDRSRNAPLAARPLSTTCR